MKREATLAIASLVVMAGCISAAEEIDPNATLPASTLLASLDAYSGAATDAEDAIVLSVDASPAGGLAAYWWQIPEGALLKDDDGDKFVAFEVAPVLLEADRAKLERWSLMTFVSQEGQLDLNTLYFGAPITLRGGGLLGGGSEEIERELEPFHMGVWGDLAEGGRVGFVVAGVASEPVEMAFVLRPILDASEKEDDPAADTEAFLKTLDGMDRIALPGTSVDAGHQVSIFFEGSAIGGGSWSVLSGPVEIDGGSAGPIGAAGARRQTVTTSFESPGWAMSVAGFDSMGSVGSWAAIADAHGVVAEGAGNVANVFGISPMGHPFVIAVGEGDEASLLQLTIDATNAGFYEGVFFVSFDIGGKLSDLLGLPAAARQFTGQTSFAIEGEDLVLTAGGVRAIAPGVL